MIKGSTEKHQQLVQKFKLYVQHFIPGIRVFDRVTGQFFTRNGKPVRTGIPGQADLYALYPTKHGMLHLEFEIKTGQARQSPKQKAWQNFIESNNGLYLIIRENFHNEINQIKEYLNEDENRSTNLTVHDHELYGGC